MMYIMKNLKNKVLFSGCYEELKNIINNLEQQLEKEKYKYETELTKKKYNNELQKEKHKNELNEERFNSKLKDKDIEILQYKIKLLELTNKN